MEFLTDDERQLTDDEVTTSLKLRGIRFSSALDRVLHVVQIHRNKAQSESIGQKRPVLLEELLPKPHPLQEDLHEFQCLFIKQRTNDPIPAAYFRRLDGVASKSDLAQLLADLQQLDRWNCTDD